MDMQLKPNCPIGAKRGEKKFLFLFLLPLHFLRRTNVAMEHNYEINTINP